MEQAYIKLSPEQIRRLVHNVLQTSVDEKGSIHFHRFTKAQQEVYVQADPDNLKRIRASASVTLDFITDSQCLGLKFRSSPGSSQKGSSVDLYVDGALLQSVYFAEFGEKEAEFLLPEGEHRVTVYFPWSAQTVLQEVSVSATASILPVTKQRKLLCFGDSITQGHISEYVSMSYVNQISRALDAEVLNQGVGGYVFDEATLDEDILSFGPDIVTVAYGTNDYTRYETIEEYADHAGKFIQRLGRLFAHCPIVAILPIYRNDSNHVERTRSRSYCLEDARQLLKGFYGQLPNCQIIEQTGIPHIPQAYNEDYLHPNAFGFSVMAQGISNHIIKQI